MHLEPPNRLLVDEPIFPLRHWWKLDLWRKKGESHAPASQYQAGYVWDCPHDMIHLTWFDIYGTTVRLPKAVRHTMLKSLSNLINLERVAARKETIQLSKLVLLPLSIRCNASSSSRWQGCIHTEQLSKYQMKRRKYFLRCLDESFLDVTTSYKPRELRSLPAGLIKLRL